MMAAVSLVAVILSLAGTASADTVTLYAPDYDASVIASPDYWNINYGNETFVRVYTHSTIPQRALLKFDLSGIPSGAIINSATLTLYSDVTYQHNTNGANPCNIPMDVFRLTNAWEESQVTWKSRLTGTPWATGGGDYVGTTGLPDQYHDAFINDGPQVQALFQYARATDNPNANDVPVSWTVTSLVDEWYKGTYANNGLIIRSYYIMGYYDSYQANHLTFRSSEYAGTDRAPKLTVNYTVSAAGGFGDWVTQSGVPEGRRGLLDCNGPLAMQNLTAYAMALNPLTAVPADLPQVTSVNLVAGTLHFIYRRAKNLSDASLTLRYSPDLRTWSNATVVSQSVVGSGNDWESIDAVIGFTRGSSAFLKLAAQTIP